MYQLQNTFDLLLQHHSQSHDESSSTSSYGAQISLVNVFPTHNISLGFPHIDGTSYVLEWIFKAE